MADTYYLQKDTNISELITQGLQDGDTIECAGYNLIVDIITCGSADPDFTDEETCIIAKRTDGEDSKGSGRVVTNCYRQMARGRIGQD